MKKKRVHGFLLMGAVLLAQMGSGSGAAQDVCAEELVVEVFSSAANDGNSVSDLEVEVSGAAADSFEVSGIVVEVSSVADAGTGVGSATETDGGAGAGSVSDAVCGVAPAEPMEILVDGNNWLGNRLMAELAEDGENVFISPYSIASALSMLRHCSEEGDQIEELISLLAYDALTEDEILMAQAELLVQLRPDYGMDWMTQEEKEWSGIGTLEIANAIYVDDQLPLLSDFEIFKALLSGYEAKVAFRPLETVETMNEINDWVNEKTHEMIPSLFEEPLSTDDVMVLLNAVYFLGSWESAFPEQNTDVQTFHGLHGNSQVSMMHQTCDYRYAETDSYQMVQIPYSSRYQMTVYLPKEISETENWTDAEYLQKLTGQEYSWEQAEVTLSMPKFELAYEAELVPELEAFGLEAIFEKRVYDRISIEPMYMSRMIHKTAISNNETGTEAAAVTAIVMTNESAMILNRTAEMTIDRPFYFTITHEGTGTNLFEGCVFDLEGQEK
ncbi:MAG: hypothetical protein IJ468_10725 [Lachnospiraceae bacterium]|nr:hypothetical protein [Lachnospiraceae bacterium]